MNNSELMRGEVDVQEGGFEKMAAEVPSFEEHVTQLENNNGSGAESAGETSPEKVEFNKEYYVSELTEKIKCPRGLAEAIYAASEDLEKKYITPCGKKTKSKLEKNVKDSIEQSYRDGSYLLESVVSTQFLEDVYHEKTEVVVNAIEAQATTREERRKQSERDSKWVNNSRNGYQKAYRYAVAESKQIDPRNDLINQYPQIKEELNSVSDEEKRRFSEHYAEVRREAGIVDANGYEEKNAEIALENIFDIATPVILRHMAEHKSHAWAESHKDIVEGLNVHPSLSYVNRLYGIAKPVDEPARQRMTELLQAEYGEDYKNSDNFHKAVGESISHADTQDYADFLNSDFIDSTLSLDDFINKYYNAFSGAVRMSNDEKVKCDDKYLQGAELVKPGVIERIHELSKIENEADVRLGESPEFKKIADIYREKVKKEYFLFQDDSELIDKLESDFSCLETHPKPYAPHSPADSYLRHFDPYFKMIKTVMESERETINEMVRSLHPLTTVVHQNHTGNMNYIQSEYDDHLSFMVQNKIYDRIDYYTPDSFYVMDDSGEKSYSFAELNKAGITMRLREGVANGDEYYTRYMYALPVRNVNLDTAPFATEQDIAGAMDFLGQFVDIDNLEEMHDLRQASYNGFVNICSTSMRGKRHQIASEIFFKTFDYANHKEEFLKYLENNFSEEQRREIERDFMTIESDISRRERGINNEKVSELGKIALQGAMNQEEFLEKIEEFKNQFDQELDESFVAAPSGESNDDSSKNDKRDNISALFVLKKLDAMQRFSKYLKETLPDGNVTFYGAKAAFDGSNNPANSYLGIGFTWGKNRCFITENFDKTGRMFVYREPIDAPGYDPENWRKMFSGAQGKLSIATMGSERNPDSYIDNVIGIIHNDRNNPDKSVADVWVAAFAYLHSGDEGLFKKIAKEGMQGPIVMPYENPTEISIAQEITRAFLG